MHISRTIVAITAILLGPTYLLVAQPASNTGPIAVLLAAGDISYCNDTRADETARIIKHEIKAAREKDASVVIRVLALGDLAYKTGTAKQLECFRGHWGDFYDILLPAPGNHEYESTNRDGKPYFDHFKKYGAKVPAGGKTVPLVVQNGEQTGYYSVDLPSTKGAWRLISLNAYAGGTEPGKKGKEKRRKAMKAQMDWLNEQLDFSKDGNKQNCVLAFWHPPIFSSGKHGHGYDTDIDAPLEQENAMLWALRKLYASGGSVVLAGHEHDYEQFSPHDADGNAAGDGIRTFVVGTGGAELTKDDYNHKAKNSEGIYGSTKGSRGVLRLELYETKYEAQFVPVSTNLASTFKKVEAPCSSRK
jgi:hypothetical protein